MRRRPPAEIEGRFGKQYLNEGPAPRTQTFASDTRELGIGRRLTERIGISLSELDPALPGEPPTTPIGNARRGDEHAHWARIASAAITN